MLLLSTSSTQMTHVAVVANPYQPSPELLTLRERFYKRAEDVGFANSEEKLVPKNPVGRPRKDRRQANENAVARGKTGKPKPVEALEIVGMAMAGGKRGQPEFEVRIEAERDDNCKRARYLADEPVGDESFAAEPVVTEPMAAEPVVTGLFLVELVSEKGHVVCHYTQIPEDFFSDIPGETLDATSPLPDVATCGGEVLWKENPLAGILEGLSDDE